MTGKGNMTVYTVGITGGSGAPYALRLLDALVTIGHEVHAVVSPAGETVVQLETGVNLRGTAREKEAALAKAIEAAGKPGRLRVFDHHNLAAPISSGCRMATGSQQATRTMALIWVEALARISSSVLSRSMAPCSRSITTKSNPARPSNSTS